MEALQRLSSLSMICGLLAHSQSLGRFRKACNTEVNAHNAAASDVEGFVCGRFLKACNTEAIKNRVNTMASLSHNDPNISLPSFSFLKACNAEAVSNEEITTLRQAMLRVMGVCVCVR